MSYRKILLQIQKQQDLMNVKLFRIYCRQVPESKNPEDYSALTYLGDTDTNQAHYIWDRAIAGKTYEFTIKGADLYSNEMDQTPLIKEFFCNPEPPSSIANIVTELQDVSLTIRWHASPSADAILKYEIRRLDNPGSSISWGSGIKIGETTDTQFDTNSFPFDTDFVIMVAAWDGYKWSEIDEYSELNIPRPVTTGDVSAVAGQDLTSLSYPGSATGWTAGTSSLSTEQTTTFTTLADFNSLTYFNGSGLIGDSNNFDRYVYTPDRKDLGFSTEVSFRLSMVFSTDKSMTFDDMNFPFAFPQLPLSRMVTAEPQYIKDYILADQSGMAGPPMENINLAGDTLAGIPITVEIDYSDTGVLSGNWVPLPIGKELHLRSYQLRFTWKPYYPGWWFRFDDLQVKCYRKNRKFVQSSESNGAGTFAVVFPKPFFTKPTLQLTPVSPVAIFASVTNWVQDGTGNYTGATGKTFDNTGAAAAGVTVNAYSDGF
jgi:hypothetical protein